MTNTTETEEDLDTPTPASVPIKEWMRRENERKAKKEAARLAGELGRDGKLSFHDYLRPRQQLR